MSEQPRLDGSFNVRDVAQAGPGAFGPLRPGVLYRSGTLAALTESGVTELAALGVSDVIDLRSDAERERDGHDRVPSGVQVHACPLDPEGSQGGPQSADTKAILAALRDQDGGAATARSVMTSVYRGFVTQPAAMEATGAALGVLANATGACVVHCTAGKDRTGWYTALVLSLCGVAQADIEADYLRSNDAAADLARLLPPLPGLDLADLGPVLGVDRGYLKAAADIVVQTYGTLDSFLDTIGVNVAMRHRIAGRFGQNAS